MASTNNVFFAIFAITMFIIAIIIKFATYCMETITSGFDESYIDDEEIEAMKHLPPLYDPAEKKADKPATYDNIINADVI